MLRFLSILLFTLLAIGATAQKNTNSLQFIENKGQWDPRVKFMANAGNGEIYLRSNGFTIVQHNPDDLRKFSAHEAPGSGGHDDDTPIPKKPRSNKNKKIAYAAPVDPVPSAPSGPAPADPGASDIRTLRSHAYTMELAGANEGVVYTGEKQESGVNNYFIGNDPSRWASECRIYGAVIYKNIYPNIDMRYFTDEGWIKYEFIVNPGGDPSQIAMNYLGADKLSVKKGELHIGTSAGEVVEMAPYTYQLTATGRREIENRYQLKGNAVRFALGSYDPQSTLVIDPTLIFATFTGSRADNWGYTATYGGDGSMYTGGIVFAPGFPVSNGAYQSNFGGSGGDDIFDMGIMKFNTYGNQMVYATYLGGTGAEQPHSLIENNRGNLIIAGRTNSSDYPTTGTFGGLGGYDIVLTELNANGSNLVGSIRIGGTGHDGLNTRNSHSGSTDGLINFYGDDARSEVMLDNAGNIYLASCTMSDNFYTTDNAPFKSFAGGGQDAVLIKTDPYLSTVLMSTYLGGKGRDAGFVLSIHPYNGDIYMGGATESSDLPGDHAGTVGPSFAGAPTDGFVAIFSGDGTVLRRTAFIGTNSRDAVLGLKFDRAGYPYVMGVTYGQMNLINAAYGTAGTRQFVGKLRPDLSAWEYRTCFGTAGASPNISPVAFLVDRCENVYVSGWGGPMGNFAMQGTLGLPVSSDAIKSTTDNADFYFIVIKRDATSLLYATFFGQNGPLSEHVDGGTSRYDQNGIIYQAMCANCVTNSRQRPRFPISPGAYCCSNGYSGSHNTGSGAQCNLAAVKIHFNFAGVGAGPVAYIDGVRDTAGCVPTTFQFADTVRNAKSYIWNFGDGTPSVNTTNTSVEYTYNQIGDYRVMLIAIDSQSCNVSDTAYVNVRVRTNPASLGFSGSKIPPCQSLNFQFVNESVAPPAKPFTDTSFIWDFGDGTRIVSGDGPIVHSFPAAGSYLVRLILNDTTYCNVGDSVVKEMYVSPLVKADFDIPNGCAPYNALITNTSVAGVTWLWDFGDGTTSTEKTPVKVFENPGTYTVTLTATDPNTCNVTDRIEKQVLVQTKPVAGFSYSPTIPRVNTPHHFTNSSSADAIRFIWEFGDGDSLHTASRSEISHQFNESGQYNVCLQAINVSGCIDTTCQTVEALIDPQIDLPNAFTPAGPAPNNIIYVKGFGIARMRFLVYNRQGQKVFESNSLKQGWDGTFNGVIQPMDVYAYVLDVEFVDGTRATKKAILP